MCILSHQLLRRAAQYPVLKLIPRPLADLVTCKSWSSYMKMSSGHAMSSFILGVYI